MVVLCIIFFALPFLLRGARQSIDTMENKVADWLPKSFPETTELRWFRKHFVGDQFVVIAWEEDCHEGSEVFRRVRDQLRAESLDYQEREVFANIDDLPPKERNEMRTLKEAKRFADELALHTTGNYHEDYGPNRDRWLLGKDGQWFFINRTGNVFRWEGQNNIIAIGSRKFDDWTGRKKPPTGTHVRAFGDPLDNEY